MLLKHGNISELLLMKNKCIKNYLQENSEWFTIDLWIYFVYMLNQWSNEWKVKKKIRYKNLKVELKVITLTSNILSRQKNVVKDQEMFRKSGSFTEIISYIINFWL